MKIAKEERIVVAAGELSNRPVVLPPAEKIIIEIGAGADVSLLEPAIGPACVGLTASAIECSIAAGAKVRLVSVRECAAHGERSYRSTFKVAQDARLEIVECRLGGGNIKAQTQVDLLGEKAAVEFRSALFAAESDHLLSEINIRHFASATTSRIITKGVLADEARLEYRGLISIDRHTVGCTGEQRAEALLLSPKARADLMPDLKIDANDVRCSHGASVAGLDERKLYYLMSRGLSRGAATEAAARGFMAVVLSSLTADEADDMEQILTPRLRCALANKIP